MELFEFLMVLVSIIIGLGIAEILTGVARVMKARRDTRYYWVHAVLTATIFVALIQQWWEAWGLRAVPQWSFLALALMMVGPICLFLIANLLFPESVTEVAFEDHYFGPMRPVWILGAVAIVGSTSFRPLFFGDPLVDPNNLTSFLGLIVFAWLFASSRRRLHALILPLVLVMLLYDVLRWSPVIG